MNKTVREILSEFSEYCFSYMNYDDATVPIDAGIIESCADKIKSTLIQALPEKKEYCFELTGSEVKMYNDAIEDMQKKVEGLFV